MSLIFRSKLYQEQIKHWALIVALAVWALTASTFALANRSQVLLIGIDDIGTRVIASASDRLIRSETRNFLKAFIELYFSYDQETFQEHLGQATEMMSADLWERSKSKLSELDEKLKKTPLTQVADIESIDLTDQGKIEAVLSLKIKSRMSEQKVRLKVQIEFRKAERTETNPWGLEIVELSDAII